MLLHTGVELELLTDIDKVLFMEGGIRGGPSQAIGRLKYANNKYMTNYDATKLSNYLIYLDLNNLYGAAMSEFLPYKSFTWLTEDEINNFRIETCCDFGEVGYILEVDLEYPETLHDLHSDLPFCPEQRAPPIDKSSRLLTTLYNKEKYTIHYKTLKQCLQHGLKMTKIYRILKFKQKPWLKGYIQLNTMLRTNARNTFESNLYKLMNNAIFGKTMEVTFMQFLHNTYTIFPYTIYTKFAQFLKFFFLISIFFIFSCRMFVNTRMSN